MARIIDVRAASACCDFQHQCCLKLQWQQCESATMGGIRDQEQHEAAQEEEAGADENGPGQPANPWNIMIKHRQVHKRGRRAQMAVSFTDPHVSMDLLRAVLQPTINEEIQGVFNKYMKFFQKAAFNVRENVGEEVDPEQLIQDVCRSSLEQAKLLFTSNEKAILRPTLDLPVMKRGRHYDDESSQRGSPVPKKRKGRPPGSVVHNDRASIGTGGVKIKSEPVRRDGPKWDPARLTESSKFVLGSRANKALGMGGTRGRIYIKHPDLFKYAADPQDKHWLAENQHMKATGGKMAYMLLEEDINELAVSDEYRSSPELKIDELKPFIPPRWMIEKMQKYIEAIRAENE